MPSHSAPITRRLSSNINRSTQCLPSVPQSPATTSSTSLAPSESVSEIASDTTTAVRSSWVWKYFVQEEVDGIMKNVCQAKEGFITSLLSTNADPDAPAAICHKGLVIDKNSSTKSMSRHLSRAHHIETPVQTEQATLPSYFADGKVGRVRFFSF